MDVIIIGGGPAGLAAAMWESHDSSAKIRVLEASSRPGGWIRSERRDGYLCEHGPQAIRSTATFGQMVTKLGLDGELVTANPESSTRWLGRRGKLRAVPSKPLAMLCSRLLSPSGKLRLLREGRVPSLSAQDGGESVASFCERRFGRETVPMVQAMLGGIFAGDARQLEAASAMPFLSKLEEQHGSVMRGMRAKRQARRASGEPRPSQEVYSFDDGIEGLVNRLAEVAGDSLETNAVAESVAREGGMWTAHLRDGTQLQAKRLILACPARVSAKLLRDSAPELATELAAIPFASLASVYLGMPMANPPPKLSGFGFLLEHEPDTSVLGAIYVSQLFPGHAPPGHQLLRVMMGGALHPGVVDQGDEELAATAIAVLERYVGVKLAPTFQHVVRCREAIPQYELGHKQRLGRVRELLQQQDGLGLRGNSYLGIAVTSQLGRDAGLGVPEQQPAEAMAQ